MTSLWGGWVPYHGIASQQILSMKYNIYKILKHNTANQIRVLLLCTSYLTEDTPLQKNIAHISCCACAVLMSLLLDFLFQNRNTRNNKPPCFPSLPL